MFQFDTVSDEEVDEYITSLLDGDEEYSKLRENADMKQYYLSALSHTKEQLQKCIKLIDKTEDYILNSDFDQSYTECLRLSSTLGKLAQKMQVLPVQFGYVPRADDIVNADERIQFYYLDNGILHITLPELLPHRARYDSNKRQFIHVQNYALNKRKYFETFKKEFEFGKFKVYDNKVVLVFLNYFTDDKLFIDADNIDTKVIIDTIASFLLVDDNPYFCSEYVDSKIGEYNHTEVFVVPLQQFPKFAKGELIKNE